MTAELAAGFAAGAAGQRHQGHAGAPLLDSLVDDDCLGIGAVHGRADTEEFDSRGTPAAPCLKRLLAEIVQVEILDCRHGNKNRTLTGRKSMDSTRQAGNRAVRTCSSECR